MKAAEVRAILSSSGLAPKKSFGQSFLVSEGVLATMAEACVPDAERGRAHVVELGAGLGALTDLLVARARHVLAVERDRDLVPLLAARLSDALAAGALAISESDAQKLDVAAAFEGAEGPRVLCGNLPYSITGRLLRLAVDSVEHVDRVVFMVQREVADRLAALPGEPAYGALSVFTRAAYSVALAAGVPAACFHPPPRVASAIVLFTPIRPSRAVETEVFRALVKAAFGARRKTLRNAWRALAPDASALEAAASAAGVSLDARGETLDVEAFARVAGALGGDQRSRG